LRDTAAKFKIPLDEMVQKLADSGFSVKLMPTPVPVPLPRPQPKKPESGQEFDVAAVDDTAPVAPTKDEDFEPSSRLDVAAVEEVLTKLPEQQAQNQVAQEQVTSDPVPIESKSTLDSKVQEIIDRTEATEETVVSTPIFQAGVPLSSIVQTTTSSDKALRNRQIGNWNKAIEAKPSDPQDQVYINAYYTGDAEQAAKEIEAIMDADIVWVSSDAQGNEYPDSVVNGLQNIKGSKPLKVQPDDDFRLHKMVQRGSLIVGHIVPLDSKLENTMFLNLDGEKVNVAITYLDKWYENAELTGQSIGDFGVVTSEPQTFFDKLVGSLFSKDENKRLKESRRMTSLGINPIVQNNILNAADRGIVLSQRRGESLEDFGKGVYNNMLALSTGDFKYVFGPARQDRASARERREYRLGKERINRMEGERPDFEKPEVVAYGSAVASHILNNILVQEPDKVNATGDKLDSRYFSYYSEQVAAGLGITQAEAEVFIRTNADIFEGGINFAIEALPYTATFGAFSVGRGVLSTAPKFQRWLTKKFDSSTFEEAVNKAKKSGFTTATLERQFAEEAISVTGINKFQFIRNTRIEGMQKRLRLAAELRGDTGSLQGLALEAADKVSKEYDDALKVLSKINPHSVKGAIEYSKQSVKVANLGRKNLINAFKDREFPSTLFDETKLEFGFAYGAAVTGEILSSKFGESYRGLGEFGGALMSFTLYAPLVKKTGKAISGRLLFGTAGDLSVKIPGLRTVYVNILKGLGELDPDQDVDDYFKRFSAGSLERQVSDLLLDNASPVFKKMLIEQAKSYKQMTESLSEITLPNGEKAFAENEILTLLANVTQLGVLRAYAEELATVVNTQNLTSRKISADEMLTVETAAATVSQQISDTLNKFDTLPLDGLTPETKDFVSNLNKTVREEQRLVDRQYNEAVRAHTSLTKQYEEMVLSGNPVYDANGDLMDVSDMFPEDFISSEYKRIVAKYVGDDGIIEDFDAFEAEFSKVLTNADKIRKEAVENFSNIGESSQASIQQVENAQKRYQANRAQIDAKFRKVESLGENARADAGVLIALLNGDTGLKALDENLADINFGIEVNADLAARTTNVGKIKGAPARRILVNKIALEFFKESPFFSKALSQFSGKNIEDMDFNEIQGSAKELADSIYERVDIPVDVRNMFDGPPSTPSELYLFFDAVFKNESFSREIGFDVGPEVMRTGVSAAALREVVGFLGKSVDPKTPAGIALMRIRNTIKNGIMKGYEVDAEGLPVLDADNNPIIDPNAGFRRDFYSSNPTDVTPEYRNALNEADEEYSVFLARYHNKKVPTHKVLSAKITEDDIMATTFVPDIINNAIKEAKKTGVDTEQVMTDRITSDYARLYPNATKPVRNEAGEITSFVIDESSEEGKQAIKEMQDGIKEFAFNAMFNSRWGKEFSDRIKKGQIFNVNMSKGRITQIEGFLGDTPQIKSDPLYQGDSIIATIKTLSKIGVKTVDENGVESVKPLITEEELWEPFRFELLAQDTVLPAPPPTAPRRGKGRQKFKSAAALDKRVVDDLKLELDNQLSDLERTKDTRSSLVTNLQTFRAALGKERPEAVFSSMLETPDGMEGLKRIKQKTIDMRVADGLSVEEATKQVELEYKNIVFENLLYVANPAESKQKLQKFMDLSKDRFYLDNLREISPVAAENLETLGNYMGNYTRKIGDSVNGVKLRGLASPFNQVSEISRLFAVWSGRVGYTFYGVSLLTSAGVRAKQASFKALLDNPEAGKILMDLLTSGKAPTQKQSSTLYKAFLTYTARDYALYSDGDYYTSVSEFVGSKAYEVAGVTYRGGADFLFQEQESPVQIDGNIPRPIKPSQRREQIINAKQQGAMQ
jgi:hypothetical protein